jgi:hypothetical protein
MYSIMGNGIGGYDDEESVVDGFNRFRNDI